MARNIRIASVVVDLVANSARYIASLRQANRDTRRYTRSMQHSFNNLSRNIAGMAAGYLGFATAINQFNKTLANAKEIEIMAQLAGQSVEEFQAAAYATNQFGINAEKLGDISKNVQDKLGDFIATGGGEFKDFFEQIAPKVGLTADQLQGLSGPDVLLRVKQAMEQANVPMEQQIFYLEAIANDASKLMPILADSGREYNRLTQEAKDLNLVLSKQDITTLRDMDKEISKVTQRLNTSFATAVIGASDQIHWLTNQLADAVVFWGAFFDSFRDEPKTIEGLNNKLVDLQEELDELDQRIKNPAEFQGDDALERTEEETKQLLAALRRRKTDVQKEYDAIQTLKNRAISVPDKPYKAPITPELHEIKLGNDTGNVKKTADEIIQENQRIAASLSQTLLSRKKQLEISYKEEQQQIRDLVLSNEETRKLGFANIDVLEKTWLQQSTANYKKARADIDAEAQNKQQQLADSLRQSLATEQELLKRSYEQQKQQIRSLVLNDVQVRAMGFKSFDALQKNWLARSKENYDQAQADIRESNKKGLEDIGNTTKALSDVISAESDVMANMAENFVYNFSTSLADMVITGKANFADLANSIIAEILRISIQMKLVNPLLKSMGILPTETIAGAAATGGPVMRGSTYLVGERGPELFTASNSGNITPNYKLGGNTQVNIYTQPGETAETRTRQTEQGDIIEVFMKQVDSRMNEQISRGQGLARTLEGRYALSRKSY